MSVNVYVKNSIYGEPDFPTFKDCTCKKGSFFEGCTFFYSHGRLCFTLPDLFHEIPKKLKKHVLELSHYTYFKPEPKRIIGIYEHDGVSAILDECDKGYKLKMSGKSIEAIRGLYHHIRKGTILPKERWDMDCMEENDGEAQEFIGQKFRDNSIEFEIKGLARPNTLSDSVRVNFNVIDDDGSTMGQGSAEYKLDDLKKLVKSPLKKS